MASAQRLNVIRSGVMRTTGQLNWQNKKLTLVLMKAFDLSGKIRPGQRPEAVENFLPA